MGFYYYDIAKNEIIDKPYYWFWAGFTFAGDSKIKELVDFVSKNEDAVFKIEGLKFEKDDDYYAECETCGNPAPLHQIEIVKIEVYKK